VVVMMCEPAPYLSECLLRSRNMGPSYLAHLFRSWALRYLPNFAIVVFRAFATTPPLCDVSRMPCGNLPYTMAGSSKRPTKPPSQKNITLRKRFKPVNSRNSSARSPPDSRPVRGSTRKKMSKVDNEYTAAAIGPEALQMSGSQPSPNNAESFVLFPKLPFELRRMI
jgi:hypothetical protein